MKPARARASALIAAAWLVALLCGAPGCGGDAAGPGVTAPPEQARATGWDVHAHTIRTDDGPRRFIVSRPRAKGPWPVVIVLHGGGMNGEAMRAYADLESRAGPHAIFVYPDAVVRNVWADEYALHWDGTRDLAFMDAVVRTVADSDLTRLYVLGLSSGAYFANQLACAWGKRVATLVAIEGGGPYGACSSPVNALIVHDPADPVVPASEGKESLTRWLAQDGCAPAAEPWPMGAPREPSAGGCRVHACADGARVATCSPAVGVHGIGPGVREASLRFFNL